MISNKKTGLVGVLLFIFSVSATAQNTAAANTQDIETAVQSSEQSLDPVEVEKWADDFFNGMLTEHRISAGAIAITQSGRVLLTKGYGYSDAAEKIPVDAATSQFRIGSLTKTFLPRPLPNLWKMEISSLWMIASTST